jgi:hypothetical protein
MLRFDDETLDRIRKDFIPTSSAWEDFEGFVRQHDDDTISTWDVFATAVKVLKAFALQASAMPSCEMLVGGNRYWRNAEGALVPVESIRPADMLEDETVRKIIGFAVPLSDQISRFWQHTSADISGFVDLVLQNYGATRGGKKGNITLSSFDDMLKVELRVAKLIEFKSDLQAAKILTDECLASWSEDSGAEIRTIVRSAFNVDKDGKVNQQALLGLLRHDFDDPRWKRAMDAIRDAIRVRTSKEYFRFFQRPAPAAEWKSITIDLAQA